MNTKLREFEVLIPKPDGSGIAEKVKVMVPVRWDEEVQAWQMTPEAHEIIDNTKARLTGLLLPAQFKELRERYGYPQSTMGELFQVGEKSWTRWESGKQRPSRSINLLIRALYEGEISINYLLKRAGKPVQAEAESLFHTFCFLSKDWKSSSPEFANLVVQHFTCPPKPVQVHLQAGKGKSAIVAHLLKMVHGKPEAAENLLTGQVPASRQRYGMPAPTHTYPQPRLTNTPTVA